MNILLNGAGTTVPDGLSVADLLRHLDIKPERVAVEINESIVRKATYAEVVVREGDRVEVVQFMGGGSGGKESVPAALGEPAAEPDTLPQAGAVCS